MSTIATMMRARRRLTLTFITASSASTPWAARRAMVMPGCIGVGPLEFPEAHMKWRGLAVLLLLLALVLSLASCATQTVPNVHKPPGFLMGLLHGFISLFSLI